MTKMHPSDISVIVPTLDAERFCGDALASIAAQTVAAAEVIVVDASSSDATVAVARSYPRVRVVQQDGRGIASAWNQGIRLARSPFLAFLSADDRWLPHKLERQLALMQACPQLGYCVSMFRYELEPGDRTSRVFNRALLGRDLVGRIMETLFARRAVFDAVGLFDASLPLAEDVDWYARAKDVGVPAAVVPEVLLHKRVHEGNASLDPTVNTPALLRVLHRSILRQRELA